jgi:ABC-2 type transport system ATP-binding protein
MLHIEKLTKIFGDKAAVDCLSLSIAPGEICGFIGHNGAGKTTTLKCCAGILQPTEGNIQIDGISLFEKPLEAKRRMAYIPDNPDIYEYLKGIRFLNFVADVYEVSAEIRNKRIDELSRLFEIRDNLAQPIREYSHGMKQKLAIIAALLHEPKLMLLDEPFVGLDPKSSHHLKRLMRDLCDRGSAIFFSTHVLIVAEQLCDKIAIIRNGHLVAAGKTEDVKGDESLEDVFLELEEQDA